MAAEFPGSRLLVYEGVGHLVLWEHPERVAPDITPLVQSVVEA
jgi:pimeloyl-ACP methyl ester carboxylesterase